jgi:CRP-like cAMP-binding protein
MYMPTAFPEPHDMRPVPDTGPAGHDSAPRGGLLSNLTLSIGTLIFRCRLEVERVNDLGSMPAVTQTRRVIRDRLRRFLQPRPSDNPLASPAGFQSASHQDQIDRAYGMRPGRNAANVVFWEALDPIEREAFRLVAFPRTFAAGARLLQEGDRADYVIVLLSGRTKICIDENGTERVLAERGPGQLVGERGALQISVRSASVIALETVQALVVRTRDFATFISAHPAALKIVENQLYDRLTERPAASGPDNSRGIPVGEVPSADGRHDRLSGRPLAQHPQLLYGENCTVILSDVARFGARTRTDEDRRIIREALFGMTHAVLQGIPDVWSWDDRGDGLLTVIPPSVPTAKVIEYLHKELPVALDEYNRACHDSARIQLRVAVNVGPVATDSMGVSGEAIIVTARLVEAPLLKEAMDRSGASLGVVVSAFIYETAVRHARDLAGYSQVQVDVKETSMTAWMKLFDTKVSPPGSSSAAA